MGLAPILYICICVNIDAMLNFDGDVDIDTNADLHVNKALVKYLVAVMADLKLCFTSGCVIVLDKEGSGRIPD